jgi:hypothetical protein
MPFTQQDLDRVKCKDPNCNCESLYVSSPCCGSQAVGVLYTKASGVLTLRCFVCEKEFIEILVSPSFGATH